MLWYWTRYDFPTSLPGTPSGFLYILESSMTKCLRTLDQRGMIEGYSLWNDLYKTSMYTVEAKNEADDQRGHHIPSWF